MFFTFHSCNSVSAQIYQNCNEKDFFFSFIFISWRLITLQYCSDFCHTLTWISHGFTCVPHPDPPSHLPPHPIPLGLPSAPALSTLLMHPTWTGDLFHTWYYHVSMLFSQIIPPSPSPIESKSLFYTSVSLFLSCMYGYHYHISKFHIHALVYCIGVYLSGLLHSVIWAPVSSISLELIQV